MCSSDLFDTPLTIERAAALAGYVQSLSAWLMRDAPFMPVEDDYLVYTYNRFQACRFGLDAVYVDPASGEHMALREHILLTLRAVERHAASLGATPAVQLLRADVNRNHNDARWLRELQSRERLLAEVIRQAAFKFSGRGC